MSNRGQLFILSAPSGTGKTSLANRVLLDLPQLRFSVSHTTRQPRLGERHGVEYFFVSHADFEQMIKEDAFLEHAFVYGNYYGTSKHFVEDALSLGNDVLLDIDVQGALKVKEQAPEALMVFVLPPSYAVLSERLRRRGLDDPRVIESRLEIAREEIRFVDRYDFVIINDVIEKAANELKSIVLSRRCRFDRQRETVDEIVATFV